MSLLEDSYFSTITPLNSTYYSLDSSSTNYNSNNSNLTDTISGNKFILPLWRQLIWTFLFGIMIIIATGGNLIVIWIVLAHKRMRTVTNYFLVNLSIADAMVSTLNVTFNYSYMLNSHWTFGYVYCKISQFIAVLTICASVFTLMAISIDRYMAIINPLRPRMGRRATLCIAIAIWIIGALMSLPMLIFYTTYTQVFPNGEIRVICYGDWPNRTADGLSYDEYLYNVVFMILTYFLPIGCMTFAYARIGLELWGSQSIGEATQRQLDNIRSKRRIVKMMIVVNTMFTVCWLPFHVYFIVTSYLPEITNEPYIQEVYLAIYWLAMSNSMYNPIIYCWMNSRFRRGFAQFFAWCPMINVSPEPLFSRSDPATSRYSCGGSPDSHSRLSRNSTVRIPLHRQSLRGVTNNSINNNNNNNNEDNNGNSSSCSNNRFSTHQRGHGRRWQAPQSRDHLTT